MPKRYKLQAFKGMSQNGSFVYRMASLEELSPRLLQPPTTLLNILSVLSLIHLTAVIHYHNALYTVSLFGLEPFPISCFC